MNCDETTPQHRRQVRAHERAVELIADGLYTNEQQETGNYGTARAALALLMGRPDVLCELAEAVADGVPTA